VFNPPGPPLLIHLWLSTSITDTNQLSRSRNEGEYSGGSRLPYYETKDHKKNNRGSSAHHWASVISYTTTRPSRHRTASGLESVNMASSYRGCGAVNWMNERKCSDLKCVRKPTKSRLSNNTLSYSLSISFWTQDLALQQIIFSIDLFLSCYRSYRGRFFMGQMTQPTVSKHWRKIGLKD